MRQRISSGSKWEELAGYSRAVVEGDWVFVSGTVGWDAAAGAFPAGAAAQAERALAVIAEALAEAGSALDDVVRVRVYVPDPADVEDVSRVLGRVFAAIRPANTTVCCALPLPEAKVEIEVTAVRRAAPG